MQLLFSFMEKKQICYRGSDTAVFLLFLLDRNAANVYTARRICKDHIFSAEAYILKID